MAFWRKKAESNELSSNDEKLSKEEQLKPFDDEQLGDDEEIDHSLQASAASDSRKKGIFLIMAFVVIVLFGGILVRSVVSHKDNTEADEAAADAQIEKAPVPTVTSDASDDLPNLQASDVGEMSAFGIDGQAIDLSQQPNDLNMSSNIPQQPMVSAELAERPPTLHERKLSSPLMVGSNGGGNAGGVAEQRDGNGNSTEVVDVEPVAQSGGNSNGALGGLLKPTATMGNVAGTLGNRNLIMVKGTFIPCYLKTRLDTQIVGMTSCVIPRDIYSANGKVILLEKGSEVTGEFQQSAAMGMNRIFVLWTRITTPNGVVISVDSPATDTLGGSGINGRVKNHWFKRFGNALLFSMIQDGMGAGFNRLARNGKDNNSGNVVYSNTKDSSDEIVKEILKSTSNIPPTIYKNQGEPVGIYLARDLNFSTVYRLRSKYIGGRYK